METQYQQQPDPLLNEEEAKQNLIELTARAMRQNLEIKKRFMLNHFLDFSKEVVGWKDFYDPLHGPMCNFMQKHYEKKRMMLIPRGHLKSSIITVGYTLWQIARNPNVRILIANGTYDLATTFLTQIKAHIERNEKFIELFGEMADKSGKWSEDQITVQGAQGLGSKESTVTVFGIGGNLVSQHYDIIILDDIVNRENIHTADRIMDVKTFYKDIQDLKDNPVTSQIIVIGTRWHEGDLYGWLLDEENPEHTEFEVMEMKALSGGFEIVKDKSTGRFLLEGGIPIFPTKFSRIGLESLLNSKGIGEFSAQYLNDPVPTSDAIFRHEFKYYEAEDLKGMEFETFITVDPAFYDPSSKTVDLDYTVFMIVKVDKANNWYIVDIIRQRMQPKEIIDMIFKLDAMYKPRTTGIESTGYQKILGYSARDMMRERNQFPPITDLKHAGGHAKSKAERIQALEPRYAVGSIFHNKYVRNITILEMELRRFPRGKTDDCADCLASMLEVAYPPRFLERRIHDVKKFLNYPA